MKLGEIQRIAVLGSGTMGPGIAQSYAMGGYEDCCMILVSLLWIRPEGCY